MKENIDKNSLILKTLKNEPQFQNYKNVKNQNVLQLPKQSSSNLEKKRKEKFWFHDYFYCQIFLGIFIFLCIWIFTIICLRFSKYYFKNILINHHQENENDLNKHINLDKEDQNIPFE